MLLLIESPVGSAGEIEQVALVTLAIVSLDSVVDVVIESQMSFPDTETGEL